MKAKKNFKASTDHLRGTFFLTGLVLSLLTVFGAFRYTVYDSHDDQEIDSFIIDGDEPIVIIENIVPKKLLLPTPEKGVIKSHTEKIEIIKGDPEPDPDELEIGLEPDTVFVFEKKEEPETTDDTILNWIEVLKMAEFRGGEEGRVRFMRKNLRYPEMAILIDLERKVEVQFVVWKDGSIRDIEVLNHKDGYEVLEREAIRVIEKMGRDNMWIPAEQRDRKVPVRFHLPIEFRL